MIIIMIIKNNDDSESGFNISYKLKTTNKKRPRFQNNT